MKTLKNTLILSLLVLLGSCGSTVKFPISTVTPAADLTAKKSLDKQKNFVLEITASNLATADRLTPPGHNYSIWIVSNDYGVKNVGQLNVTSGKKTTFSTMTPFDFNEVFITVESEGGLNYPKGQEISRVKI